MLLYLAGGQGRIKELDWSHHALPYLFDGRFDQINQHHLVTSMQQKCCTIREIGCQFLGDVFALS